MDLAELQELFFRAIAWPTGVADFLAQADAETVAAFEDAFAETPEFTRAQRVDIYAESYFWRLFETLQTQFAVTAWLAGEAGFRNLVTDYVLARPSRDPDLRRFGASFPAFLSAHPIVQAHPYLPFCSEVELTMMQLLDAADITPLALETVAAIPADRWPQLRFVPAPTLALMASPWRYSPLSEACRGGRPASEAPLAAADNVHTLIWREGMHVMHRSVPPSEAKALSTMIAGGTFAEVCSAADASGAGIEAVAGWLHRWIEAELLIDCAL